MLIRVEGVETLSEYNKELARYIKKLSLNGLVSETYNVSLGQLCIGRGIDACVSCGFFRKPNLGLVIDSEVREFCLNTNCDLLTDVGHLKSFLPKIPLVPGIVRLDVLINEMCWSLHALINHEWGRDREERMHTVFTLEESSERGFREVILHLKQMDQLWLPSAALYNFI